jgi:tetratricopeptide (TPR) repeat protein
MADRRRALAATDFGGADPASMRSSRLSDAVFLDEATGDYAKALKPLVEEAQTAADPNAVFSGAQYAAYEAAYLHDVALSRIWTQRASDAAFAASYKAFDTLRVPRLRAWQAADVDDWAGAAASMAQSNMVLAQTPSPGSNSYWIALQAIWSAKAGQVAPAKALAESLPPDCYFCLLARGFAAEAAGDRTAADGFFRRAVTESPSSVRGYYYWGRAKLARGDVSGAIDLFRQANGKGPHFADALEGWGEGLMRQSDFSGAVAKFKEAAVYAPNWGGNHLHWGEALDRLGRKDQARTQYEMASKLALSEAEQAALAADRKAGAR